MFNQKGDAAVMVSEHAIAVEPSKIAPVAPVAPIQAPATLKR
jgi:hypothetical protein